MNLAIQAPSLKNVGTGALAPGVPHGTPAADTDELASSFSFLGAGVLAPGVGFPTPGALDVQGFAVKPVQHWGLSAPLGLEGYTPLALPA